jgi:hypothetical protein
MSNLEFGQCNEYPEYEGMCVRYVHYERYVRYERYVHYVHYERYVHYVHS